MCITCFMPPCRAILDERFSLLPSFSFCPCNSSTTFLVLHTQHTTALQEEGAVESLLKIEVPLVRLLGRMEARGILLDSRVFDQAIPTLSRQLKALERKVQE